MRAHKDLYGADVVAMFENQDDADEAVLQLRLLGLPNDHIGYFAQHPERGWMDLIDHNLEYIGALVGGIVVAVLGVWLSQVINGWSRVRAPAIDPAIGSFIIAVSAGELHDRAWSVIRDHGGHELPPGAERPQSIAV